MATQSVMQLADLGAKIIPFPNRAAREARLMPDYEIRMRAIARHIRAIREGRITMAEAIAKETHQ